MKRRKARSEAIQPVADRQPMTAPRWTAPFWVSLAGGVLMFASFAPLEFSWLVWVAPLPWFWLITPKQLTGWRPYLQMWAGMLIAWLMLLEGVRRAHPANNFGCLALSGYLAAYLPVFVFATRAAVHRARVSVILAAPVVWTALELARGYLLTGFSMVMLGHAIAEWTTLIQIADVFGAYGVSFLVMLVAACVAAIPAAEGIRAKLWPISVAAIAVVAASGYGWFRLQFRPPSNAPSLKVVLLQGTTDKLFELNMERERQTFEQYWTLMQRARKENSDLDVIVWPEGTFSAGTNTDLLSDGEILAPAESGYSDEQVRSGFERGKQRFEQSARDAAAAANRIWRDGEFVQGDVHLLVGAETIVLGQRSMRMYNSALHVAPRGDIVSRYSKLHPVMFGEYIPLGHLFPWLYRLTPMRQGLDRGDGPRSFDVKGWSICPSICFESTVPHLVREQCNSLERSTGHAPDLLVNVTDDGWFWGSSVLDYQLVCAVFRAVEMRRPMLVAANTGISAWIDGSGQIVNRGPKRQEHVIVAEVHRDGRWTLYRWWGDCPAIVCLMLMFVWIRKGARR